MTRICNRLNDFEIHRSLRSNLILSTDFRILFHSLSPHRGVLPGSWMPMRFIFFVGSLTLLLALYLHAQQPIRISYDLKDYPYEFTSHKVEPQKSIFVDLNSDGIDEQLNIQESSQTVPPLIVGEKYGGIVIDQLNFPRAEKISYGFAYDLDHQGTKQIFVVEYDPDTIFVDIADILQPKLVRKIPVYCYPNPGPHSVDSCGVDLVGILHSTKSNADQLVILFKAAYSNQRRGIAGIDLKSGRMLWEHPMGTYPWKGITENIAGSDGSEIFVTSMATNNGASRNGTSDSSSYIFGFSPTGSLLWEPKRCGGLFTSTSAGVLDWNNDGHSELITYLRSGTHYADESYIARFDPASGKSLGPVRKVADNMSDFSGDLPVLEKAGQKILVAWLLSGTVLLLDHSLQLISQKSFDFQSEIEDFTLIDSPTGDHKFMLVRTATGRTVFFDEDLNPMALTEGTYSGTRRDPDNVVQLVFQNHGQTVIGVLSQRPQSYSFWIGLFIVAIGFVVVGYTIYGFVFYVRLYRTVTRGNDSIGVLVLNARGKILHGNEAFGRLLAVSLKKYTHRHFREVFKDDSLKPLVVFVSGALKKRDDSEDRIDLLSGRGTHAAIVRGFPIRFLGVRMGMLVVLTDISTALQTDRMINWALVAHNLAHEMKTPLSTIWFTLERLKQTAAEKGGPLDQRYVESISEELRRLDGYVKGFMKLADLNAPNLQESDLNKTIEELLDEYTRKLPESIHLQVELSDDLPDVKLDVNLFTVAVTNLLDNAVRAMEGKGTLKLSSYLVQDLQTAHVCLTISDTGSGVAAEDAPKIFNPYFSKSHGGTGLGLVITKKIVEDHGGNIQFTSKQGLGTEFVIELPVTGTNSGNHHA